MPTISITSRLLRVYADKEPWRRDHDEAQSCLDVEERMAWGVRLYQGMLDLEARTQTHASKNLDPVIEQLLDFIPALYQIWTDASEFYLQRAVEFSNKGYEIDGLEEFRTTVEEARCLVDNLNFEEQIRPIEDLIGRAMPDNPRPERYRD